MAVTVRLFAAAREAAGTGQVWVDPGPLPALLDELRERFGPAFAKRLALCTILVDGDTVRPDADRQVPDGAEVAVLPPVSGGASGA